MATTVPSMSIFGDSPFSGVQWTGDETQHLLLASHGTRISLYKTNYIPPSSSSSSRKSSSSQVASVTLPGTASAIGLRMLSPNSSSASAVARADGSLNFISCSDSLSLAIHSTLQHVFRRSLQETCTGVDAVQDGSLLAIVGDHGSLAFVDCNSSNSAAVVEHVVERVSGMALTDVCWKGFSQIACTSFSGHVLIVDRRTGKVVQTLIRDVNHPPPLQSLSVHPTQNHRIVTGSQDGEVQLWDLRMETSECQSFDVHGGVDVWGVAFHPNESNTVLSCAEDGTVA